MKIRNLILVLALTGISITVMSVTRSKAKNKAHASLYKSDRKLLAIESSGNVNSKFTYDSAGSLIQVQHGNTKTEYQVKGDTLSSYTWDVSRNKRTEFFLADFSENGFMAAYDRWYILSGDTTRMHGEFHYNDEGLLEEQKLLFNEGDEWQKLYTYDHGNLTGMKVYKNKRTVSSTTWEYTAHTDMLRIDFNRLYDAALNLTGPANTKLPSRKVVVNAKGVVQLDESYTYELDANGYVIQRTTTSGNGAFEPIVEKFVYAQK